MVELKQFSGILNTDDSNEVIPLVHHKFAVNGRFRNGRFENLTGNTLKANPFLPVTGTNENIGAWFCGLKNRIYTFNYNSLGLHGIYMYDILTDTFYRIILIGYNTNGDILNFTLDGFIYGVRVLYGDSTQGDTLSFINSQKQPCCINVERALAGSYGTIERSYINVIKSPFSLPPLLTYRDNATRTVNNLRKKLFKFKLRSVYKDNTKGVWSSQGELPLPSNYIDSEIDKDPTKNCEIVLVIPTGEGDVTKIEIAVAISNGNGYSDYELCKVIDKDALSIPSNDITTYLFLNDKATTPIDIIDSIQTYDYVPLTALGLEFLNGNVPIYSCITEGYNPILMNGTIVSSTTPEYTTQAPFIFTANQSGDSGFGTGNIHAVLIGTVVVGNVYRIYTTNELITFTAATTTTASVITGLSAAAVLLGFTIVSSDTENLVFTKTGESLQRTLAIPVLIPVSNSFVYDWNSLYDLVAVYFDKEGRTIGAQSNDTMSFQTANYTETSGVPNIPKLTLSLFNRPPSEAFYFQIGRSLNLTKLRTFYWITDRTYKDSNFAYIGIENINSYIKKNPSSSFLAYEPAINDRIRFIKKISGTATIYTTNDFEIHSQKVNPEINGEIKEGQFLKIALPTVSGTFDFGSSDFNNYLINLYTPAQSNAENLDSYYEFGERYTIGDPTLSTRYHQGMIQNQTSNLSQPATFELTKGDDYLRKRIINVGSEYQFGITAGGINEGRFTLGCNFVSATFTDANITTGNSPLQDLAGFTLATNTTRPIISIGTGNFTFRIKCNIIVRLDGFGELFSFFAQTNNGYITSMVKQWQSPYGLNQALYESIPQGAIKTFPVDITVNMTTGERLFLFGWSQTDANNLKNIYVSDLTITRELFFTQTIIDQNFSDFFESKVNSNATAGRTFNIDPNAAQVTIPSLLRWGLDYEPNSNLNRSNRFRALNQTEADRSKGKIQLMKVRGNMLRIFQEAGCASTGIYSRFVRTDSGNILTATDEILTKNNFDYYDGMFGVGNQPTGVSHGQSQDFFIDPIRGYHCMIGASGGIVPLSELYKGQYYIQPLFSPYNNNYLRANGAKAKIISYYDFADEESVTFLQGGDLGLLTIPETSFSFDVKNKGYSSFLELAPENIICANDVTYAWKNGEMWIHNNTNDYCNFFGVQYVPSIRLVFNKDIAIKKVFNTSSYESNRVWSSDRYDITDALADSIKTSFFNIDTTFQQISELKTVDYSNENGKMCAAFNRDKNSGTAPLVAVLDGDYLQGNWIEIEYLYRGSEFAWLFLPQVLSEVSNRNF